jgi:hypothetical protein
MQSRWGDATMGRLHFLNLLLTGPGAIQTATEVTHLFTVPAPRGPGVTKSLEAGRPLPATCRTP